MTAAVAPLLADLDVARTVLTTEAVGLRALAESLDARFAVAVDMLQAVTGRVVVSGPGYIRILIDDKNEGKSTRSIDVIDGLREGAQGLLWEGDTLYYSADGGLRRRYERRLYRADRFVQIPCGRDVRDVGNVWLDLHIAPYFLMSRSANRERLSR